MLRLAAILVLAVFGCKPRAEQAASQLEGSVELKRDAPPAISYHFGQYRYLRGYGDRQGGLTDQEWVSIPSNKKYVGYRRGFYVSQHPAYNERYAMEYLTATKDLAPWVAEIHLKPECTEPTAEKRRFALDVRTLASDPRFVKWINEVDPKWNIDIYNQQCPAEAYVNQEQENVCGQIVNIYYRSENIGVAYDHLWAGSGFWLIRDNQCIEAVRSSPESVLEMFARVKELWRAKPYDTDQPRETKGLGQPTQALFHVLVRALAETATPNPEVLQRIEASAKDSDYPVTSDAVEQTLKVARDCLAKGDYAGFQKQADYFLSKAEERGYLNVPKPATPGAPPESQGGITYDLHMRRFVSVGLPRACAGARETMGRETVAKAEASTDAASLKYVCAVANAETCKPGQKAFMEALAESGSTAAELNLVRVYIDYDFGGVLDGFGDKLSIPYQASKNQIIAQLKKHREVVDATKEFRTLHSEIQITCAVGGSTPCLAAAHVLRGVLNGNPNFTAKSLRISSVDIDYDGGFYQANYVDVPYEGSANAMTKVFEQRLDYLKAQDQIAATLSKAKVRCTVGGGGPCSKAFWNLGKALAVHPEFTDEVLRIETLTVDYDSDFLANGSVSLNYEASPDAMNKVFAQRVAYLADLDAHQAIFPKAALQCEVGGSACRTAAARLYKAATLTNLTEKDLGIKRITLTYDSDYTEEDSLLVNHEASPSAIKALYDKRKLFVDQRAAFRRNFEGVAVQCAVGGSACKRFMEGLYVATSEMGITAATLGIKTIVIDYDTKIDGKSEIRLNHEARGSGLIKQLRAREAKSR